MRKLIKLEIPDILADKQDEWLGEYLHDKCNTTKKYRYRHPDIKLKLKEETAWKCIYCESKIGHNTPGDVEHMIPSSKKEEFHFIWENLTVACTECNRRKSDYFEEDNEFLNPYIDDVENLVEHYGPVMGWLNGNIRAEITIKTLELNGHNRISLISRKIEKIEEFNNLIERFINASNIILKALLKRQIVNMLDIKSEYSGMLLSIKEQKGLNVN